jgi:hypothetical protein
LHIANVQLPSPHELTALLCAQLVPHVPQLASV